MKYLTMQEIENLRLQLENLKTEQEELEESGDLEDRFEIAQNIADIERRLLNCDRRD